MASHFSELVKRSHPLASGLILFTGLVAATGCVQPGGARKPTPTAFEMTAIPDGYYLVNLRIDGRERLANFEIKNYQARCVNTDYAKLKNLRGAFQWVGN